MPAYPARCFVAAAAAEPGSPERVVSHHQSSQLVGKMPDCYHIDGCLGGHHTRSAVGEVHCHTGNFAEELGRVAAVADFVANAVVNWVVDARHSEVKKTDLAVGVVVVTTEADGGSKVSEVSIVVTLHREVSVTRAHPEK